jgi:hypothetical protein
LELEDKFRKTRVAIASLERQLQESERQLVLAERRVRRAEKESAESHRTLILIENEIERRKALGIWKAEAAGPVAEPVAK